MYDKTIKVGGDRGYLPTRCEVSKHTRARKFANLCRYKGTMPVFDAAVAHTLARRAVVYRRRSARSAAGPEPHR